MPNQIYDPYKALDRFLRDPPLHCRRSEAVVFTLSDVKGHLIEQGFTRLPTSASLGQAIRSFDGIERDRATVYDNQRARRYRLVTTGRW